MPDHPVRYRSSEEDSARWLDFPFRAGDIVISTRSKSGTTWMQMICALLIFQDPELPEPLGRLSPWLDWLVEPQDELVARLRAQQHRRFLKTHTPLDGVVLDPRATYIVVGRDPLDMAVSGIHQSGNIDRERLHELTGAPIPERSGPPRPVRDRLLSWIEADEDPRTSMDSLAGVMWHLSDAWARQEEQPNVLLVHYEDLSTDLAGQMRRIADRLGITVPEPVWPMLIEAATFRSMRADADRLVPATNGVLKSSAAFFRRGGSGSGRELLTEAELASYRDRISRMGPQTLPAWPGPQPVPGPLVRWLDR